jgi:hypothetical protein
VLTKALAAALIAAPFALLHALNVSGRRGRCVHLTSLRYCEALPEQP